MFHIYVKSKRFVKLAEIEDKFIEEQVGVRAGYDKDDHISTLHAIVQNVLQKIESDM